MSLEKFLTESRATVLKRWFDAVVDAYPPETTRLLKKEKNQFANPVGHSLSQGMEGIYDELARGLVPEKVQPHLDKIIRIRAIQDFSPSQAVAFIFHLKKIFRDVLGDARPDEEISPQELLALETQIDSLALLAFNIYMECREKLCEVRIAEVKNRSFRLLQRANLLTEIPEHESESQKGSTPIT